MLSNSSVNPPTVVLVTFIVTAVFVGFLQRNRANRNQEREKETERDRLINYEAWLPWLWRLRSLTVCRLHTGPRKASGVTPV